MNTTAKDLAREILREKGSQEGDQVDRLGHVLKRLRQASRLDVRQPVLLRKDEDGLFALLPEERGGSELALCTCWCLGDEKPCSAYPGRSLVFSEVATGDDAKKILDFLRDKGYSNLWIANKLGKNMYIKRMSS